MVTGIGAWERSQEQKGWALPGASSGVVMGTPSAILSLLLGSPRFSGQLLPTGHQLMVVATWGPQASFSSYFIIVEHRARPRLDSALFLGPESLPLCTPGQPREPVVLRHSGVTGKC